MADLGFLPAVTRILDATPGRAGPADAVLRDAGPRRRPAGERRPGPKPRQLHAVASDIVPNDVDHQVFVLPAQDKVTIAAEIGLRPGRTLFFVRTKHGADRLAKQLSRAGVDAAAIHGNLNQNQPVSARSPRSRRGIRASLSRPMWPPAASTSTTSGLSCISIRPMTTRTTCTARGVPPRRRKPYRRGPRRACPGP